MMIHVAGGSVALLSGGAALALRKGSRLHGSAGGWFLASMLTLTGTGAVMAAFRPERGTAVIGILTCYLVVTSWWTAQHREGRAGRFERAGLVVAVSCAIAMLTFGVWALNSSTGRLDSLPPAAHFPFAGLMAIAAGLDLNFILRGELSGVQRIARHLWRMCAALLIAAFSFFLGQQKVMPEIIQGSPLLFAPPLGVLAAMIFWIIRVRYSKAFRWVRPRCPAGAVEAAAARLATESA